MLHVCDFIISYGVRFSGASSLTEAAAKKLVDVGWEKAAQLVSSAFAKGEAKTDAEQVAQIRQVSSGLDALRQAVGQEYLSTFLAAGQMAVEAQLRADHLPEAKAKRIAAAVAKEVAGRLAPPANG